MRVINFWLEEAKRHEHSARQSECVSRRRRAKSFVESVRRHGAAFFGGVGQRFSTGSVTHVIPNSSNIPWLNCYALVCCCLCSAWGPGGKPTTNCVAMEPRPPNLQPGSGGGGGPMATPCIMLS